MLANFFIALFLAIPEPILRIIFFYKRRIIIDNQRLNFQSQVFLSFIEKSLKALGDDPVKIRTEREKNNLKILQNKKIHITKEEAADFYKEHQSKPFYDSLCNYLSSGPIIVMELSGENAIQNYRTLMGATDPKEANKNTIRQLYGVSIDKNSVHGSDSVENAKKEIEFFFKITKIV